MSNNTSSRLSNTVNSAIGGTKQSMGRTFGNRSMAASGAEQKAAAEARQSAADAKTHSEGAAHHAKGKIQHAVGSMTGNTSMKAKGHANQVQGDMERNI